MSVDLHKPRIVTDGGPWAQHDHACAVCGERKSVLDLSTGRFLPCWSCTGEGWRLVQRPSFVAWFTRKLLHRG